MVPDLGSPLMIIGDDGSSRLLELTKSKSLARALSFSLMPFLNVIAPNLLRLDAFE